MVIKRLNRRERTLGFRSQLCNTWCECSSYVYKTANAVMTVTPLSSPLSSDFKDIPPFPSSLPIFVSNHLPPFNLLTDEVYFIFFFFKRKAFFRFNLTKDRKDSTFSLAVNANKTAIVSVEVGNDLGLSWSRLTIDFLLETEGLGCVISRFLRHSYNCAKPNWRKSCSRPTGCISCFIL